MLSNNKKLLAALAIVVLVVAAVLFKITSTPQKPTVEDIQPLTNASEPEAVQNKPKEATLVSQWQWEKIREQRKEESEPGNPEGGEALPFTPQSVHDALQAVRLDDDGNIILDNDALFSLDEALERIHNKLDSESLRKLQDLIEEALPGKVGQQTAKLVGDYYQFLEAQEEFNQIHGVAVSNVQTISTIVSDQALYGELQSLRELHLGREAATGLFRASDANAEFMFENMKLDLDTTLTPEEKAKRREETQAKLVEQLENS